MLWDTHMHTHFSGDSEADSSAMARAAVAKISPESALPITLIMITRMIRIYSSLILISTAKKFINCSQTFPIF
mgnify:FL=1